MGCIQTGGCLHLTPKRRQFQPAPREEMPAMEYLLETLIPIVFYTAVLLFMFTSLTEGH